MNKFAYLVVALLLISAIGLPLFSEVSATTYVGGALNGNATWTASNSPYSLTENLIIYSGETLYIQPGVVVNLRGYQIQVYGGLNVQGTNNNKIFFLSDGFSNSQIVFKSSSSQSSTIDYGVFYSVPITIDGGAPLLTNSYFTGTSSTAVITVTSGVASIVDNVISTSNAQSGIHITTGYVTISGNTISGARAQQGFGIYNTGSTAPITANKITTFYTGIYTNKPCLIEQNIITNNVNDGLVIEGTSGVTIRNNAITHNKCGISRDADIQNNTISRNTYGLWGQTDRSIIKYNNIVDNTIESIHLTESADVTVINNWWGTTDGLTIRKTISDYDSALRPNLGVVTFLPVLVSPAYAPAVVPSVVVPTPPPTPSPTPSPTPQRTVTPSPGSNITFTPTPRPTAVHPTPTYSPYPTYPDSSSQPVQPTDEPGLFNFSITDITTTVVIVVAVSVAIAIIVILSRMQSNKRQDNYVAP